MSTFDTWRYYHLPAGPRAALASARLASLQGERAPLVYLRWRPDRRAALLALPPGTLPKACAVLADNQLTYAAALALCATPEWTPPTEEP